jgi:short subunit dehydrogenase-like uncharacterized protein
MGAMSGRIVVFGASGYTGELVTRALVAAGRTPVVAGRSRAKLEQLAGDLGLSEVVTADAGAPDGSMREHLDAGDVLVSTVGPFTRLGAPAISAAVNAGAHYVDSTGEAPFIRRAFDVYGPRAQGRSAVLPAMGYDFVPGNLAGALALRKVHVGTPARVDVGYFLLGRGSPSSGTLASSIGIMAGPAHSWRDGRIVEERFGQHVRAFAVRGKQRDALSLGGTEAYGLPRLAPGLQAVTTYLGWLGPYTRPAAAAAAVPAVLRVLPGAQGAIGRLTDLAARRTGRGPGDETRAAGRSYVTAVVSDASGELLAEAHLEGVEGYTYTGRMMAWAAGRLADGAVTATGALTPVEAFGLDDLAAGNAEVGLSRVQP